MTSWPAAPAMTELTNPDLANFEAVLREQRRFRQRQLAELSTGQASGMAAGHAFEVADVLEHAARHALGEIELALDRLRCGRYGRCVDCGQAIGRDRLEVLPSAARCMPCQHRIGNGRPPPHRHALPRRTARSAR
jgi:DnaK suppressor protein